MNAYMNINVRVLSANAQAQIKALQAQVAGLQKQLAGANATSAATGGLGSPRSRKSLAAWGNQIQWTGRQLQYNWTIPIALAGAAATKFALDNEKAMTRVTKVYGDAADATAWFNKHQKQIPEGMTAGEAAAQSFANELDALGESFEALSSRYGIQQKQVIETAAAWAAAGESGVALAESTELSIKAAILGDMDLAKATEALIAIQAQYSLSTKGLSLTLAELNAIENQTGISMQGLIDGFARSAGVAREAGVDVRHLGAMLAALVPATGSAATAGNALKTIISRLMSPTGDAAAVMKEFGVNTSTAAWQSSTAMERLMILADKMGDGLKKSADGGYVLSDSQKQVVASVLGSRYQMNRFLVLMRELGPEQSYYEKALGATADRTKVFAQAQKELDAVLASSPKRLEIMWYTLQNGLADAIQPLIPYIIYLTQQIAEAVHWFSELDPEVQKLALTMLVLLAAVGPLVKYTGSLMTLLGTMWMPIAFLRREWIKYMAVTKIVDGATVTTQRTFMGLIGTMLAMPFTFVIGGLMGIAKAFWLLLRNPGVVLASLKRWGIALIALLKTNWKAILRFAGVWGLLAAAIMGILYHFRDELGTIWNNIIEYFADSNNLMVQTILRAWNALPQGVANALIAVANVVQKIALQIYEWFSYINPFAHHSPSLVENVTEGMRIVSDQFAIAGRNIGAHVKGAYQDIKTFGNAVRKLTGGAASFEAAQERASVKKFAPGALAAYDQLSARLKQLNRDLAMIEARQNRQQAIVDRWTAAVDRANKKLEAQEKILQKLQDVQQGWQDKLDEAQGRLDSFANAPITGMREMSDAIFENDMAQKRLRLEMMKMEEVTGPLDDIRSKLDAINGAQEFMRGEQASLRSAGAGSEILGFYDDQIAALEDQKQAQTEASEALQNMSDALDELQRKGEMLDLENSLAFDPLTRQIEQAANAMNELPFDEIMAGVTQAAADVQYYQGKLNTATAAVAKQQTVVDKLTAARDRLQSRLDIEQDKLDKIKESYDKVADAISGVEEAMQGASSAADTLSRKAKGGAGGKGGGYVSPAVQNFRDAAGGNFANVGGAGLPMRKNWKDQSAEIKAFTDSIAGDAAKAFGGLNPFAPIKRKWGEFKAWWNNAWGQAKAAVQDMMGAAFAGTGAGGGIGSIVDGIKVAWVALKDWFMGDMVPVFQSVWSLIGKPLKEFITNVWRGLQSVWKNIAPEVAKFADEFDDLIPALRGLKNVVKLVVGYLVLRFSLLASILLNIAANVIKPMITTIGNVMENLIQIIRGAFQIVVGILMLFTSDWREGLKKIVAGVWNILSGLGGIIGNILKGAFEIAIGLVVGVVKGIWRWFVWLWDVLVGHSVIPDMIDGIIHYFEMLMILPKWLWNHVIKPVYNFFKAMWTDYVGPFLRSIWGKVKLSLAGWKMMGRWVWDNVLRPAWNKVQDLWGKVGPELRKWWERIKVAWVLLKLMASWVWNNVLKPAWNKIKDLWSLYVKPELGKWWERIKLVWNSLTSLGKWIKNNVMDPVLNAFKNGWGAVKDWMNNNKGILTNPVKAIVNVVISAVNAMIRGLNKIADVLPGIDWEINLIEKLAGGGAIPNRRVGSGFMTNGARAIVGEGKQNHPEFVIPTDPTYRKRARSLLAEAASRLGATDGPAFASGGFLPANAGGVWNTVKGTVSGAVSKTISGVKSVGDYLEKNGRRALVKLMEPFLNSAKNYVKKADWSIARNIGNWGIDEVKTWVAGAQDAFNEKEKKLAPAGLGYVSRSGWTRVMKQGTYSRGEPPSWKGGYAGHTGQDFPARKGNLVYAPHSGSVSFQTFPGSNPYNSTPYRSYGKLAILSGGGVNTYMAHLDSFIGREGRVGPGTPIGRVGMNGNATGPHLHLEVRGKSGLLDPIAFFASMGVPMSAGGVALARRGGTLLRAGEAGKDEAVIPLPTDWRRSSPFGTGDTHVTNNFYGDLEFPNVSDGSDAEDFIKNLETLAGDG